MTRHDEGRLGPVLSQLRGTLALGGYQQYLAAFVLVAGVLGVVRGQALDGVYGLAVGALLMSPFLLSWRQEVTVRQDGFVWRRLTGTKTVLRSEIKSVRRISVSSYLRGNYEVVEVNLTGGQSLLIGRIEDASRLARLLADTEPAPMADWQPSHPAERGAQ